MIALPLTGLARAMARMGDPHGLPPARAAAARRLLDAMAAEPLMVSGSTGFATALLRAAGGRVRAKPGAEGVYAAALPQLGFGLALKIEDGAARAAEVALATVLQRLGVLDDGGIGGARRACAPSATQCRGHAGRRDPPGNILNGAASRETCAKGLGKRGHAGL